MADPTKEELLAAFEEFKKKPVYGNLIQHVGEGNIGCIWMAFSQGYIEGAKR